jgi:hypothetical protein
MNRHRDSPSSSHKNALFVDVVGWYGMSAIVGAYVLVSFNVLDSKSAWYQLLNLTGALGIGAVSWAKRALQPAVLNLVWSVIAVVALVRIAI